MKTALFLLPVSLCAQWLGFPYGGDSADRGWEAEPGGSGAQNARRQTGFVRDLEARSKSLFL
jgi:hypothetical protein